MVGRSLFLIAGLGALVALGCEGATPSEIPQSPPRIDTPEPESPSLVIGGPALIRVKGTIRYTAAVSHFAAAPTIVWSERFCGAASVECTPWTNVGVGNTHTRTLGPDCSIPGRSYQLEVTAQAGSQVVVATKTSFLCEPL